MFLVSSKKNTDETLPGTVNSTKEDCCQALEALFKTIEKRKTTFNNPRLKVAIPLINCGHTGAPMSALESLVATIEFIGATVGEVDSSCIESVFIYYYQP